MTKQPLLLAIETATKVCSIALFKGNKLLAFKEESGAYSHAENLAAFAQELLQKENLSFTMLNAVVVSKGPGSYTGLRIGVSFAKGLCFALNIPLIAVNTLEGMTWAAIRESEFSEAYYCPMIDARRMEVYTTIFNSKLEQLEPVSASIIDKNLFESYYNKHPFYVFGDGSAKALSSMKDDHVIHLETCFPSAKNLGEIANLKYDKKEFENLAYFEPFYLKEFMAVKPKSLI